MLDIFKNITKEAMEELAYYKECIIFDYVKHILNKKEITHEDVDGRGEIVQAPEQCEYFEWDGVIAIKFEKPIVTSMSSAMFSKIRVTVRRKTIIYTQPRPFLLYIKAHKETQSLPRFEYGKD